MSEPTRYGSAAAGSHPRPDRTRPGPWWSLDGPWELVIDHGYRIDTLPGVADREIRVPFSWESVASGVALHWLQRAWYRRRFAVPEPAVGERAVLHIGAAHHTATVYADGRELIRHVGGQEPFEVDLTQAAGRTVELVVRVDAPRDKRLIPHGKQRSVPADPYDVCSFTPCSGIWQSVWLEHRPVTHLDDIVLDARPELDGFCVRTSVVAGRHGDRVRVRAAPDEGWTDLGEDGAGTVLVTQPRLWAPATPHLYPVEVELLRAGEVIDRVVCTAGLRTIEVVGGQVCLNGDRIFLRGVLDQGYWPGSGWTAPGEDALIADLQLARRCGFTMVRKHLKLEDPRWLHHADRLGMLVWSEPPCPSVFHPDAQQLFDDVVAAMIRRDRNHPSIVIWGLYNEEWGLDWAVDDDPARRAALRRAYRRARALDPTRLVVDNSGWSHVESDLADWHVYADDLAAWRHLLEDLDAGGTAGFPVDLGAAGRVRRWVRADHGSAADQAGMNSEYGTGRTSVERAWAMRWQTQELRRSRRLNGYVYTELYDIEHETAGVLTDHRAEKDTLNLNPADTHADTVIVIDATPIRPGLDVVTPPGDPVRVDLQISHHGTAPVEGIVQAAWSAPYGRADGVTDAITAPERVGSVVAKPFHLSERLTWTGPLPPGRSHARLHLWLEGHDGAVIARTVVDVGDGAIGS